MRISIWAAIAFDVCVLIDTAFGQQQATLNVDPLIGQWNGKWSYTTGKTLHQGTFELFFENKSGHLQGRFVAVALMDTAVNPANKSLIGKPRIRKLPHRAQNVQDITRTVSDPPNYRFYVDGQCWNVTVKENLMAGFRNTGHCSSMGLGSATRLVDVEAERVTSDKR